MQSSELKVVLSAGAVLAGSGPQVPSSDLKAVLASRLTRYAELLGLMPSHDNSTLEAVQFETALAALHVVQEVQRILHDGSEMIGTRDMAQLRTLSSIIFKWATEPLLSRVISALPATNVTRQPTTVKIIDLTSVPEDYDHLLSIITTFLDIILPSKDSGPLSHTPIVANLVDKHLGDLLRPCIALGWLPKSLSSESIAPLDDVRPLIIHILTHLPVSQSVSALSSVLSSTAFPTYVKKTCGFLLSRQILRRDGVRGLFIALFSEEDISGDTAPLEKLEHVAKLLQAIPAGVNETGYYQTIIPQLLSILSSDSRETPPSHNRAAAFTLSRMAVPEQPNPRFAAASRILLQTLHRPLLQISSTTSGEADSQNINSIATNLAPRAALTTLITLLTNTDPAPGIITNLLTPIIPSLFSLWNTFGEHKTTDPTLRTSVRGLLETWGRLVGEAEGVAVLWLIVQGEGGSWSIDVAGEITRVEEGVFQPTSLSLFTPEDLRRAEESGELDVNANILHLRPDPIQFVDYLKSIDRVDMSSEIFVRLLAAYQEARGDSDNDPMRTLLYLQIIMQIQSQLSANDSSTNILKKPEHILSFVKSALETSFTSPEVKHKQKSKGIGGLTLEDLRIVEVPDEDQTEGDSDDEDSSEGTPKSGDDEMTTTAMNLLLSILEANSEMTTSNTPLLDNIFDLLVRLAREGSETIRPLAREARMVLIARLASTSAPSSTSKSNRTSREESTQETYQKALKLLQDPLLPVRAHGLLLLRQLVASRPTKEGKLEEPSVDRALIPGILSIFLQSLQDDDSYIYLNAVQGLAAMVDGFGKEVLRGLVEMYAEGSEGIGSTALTKEDVDTRTKIGEALGQIIRRCGDALPQYADILVPPLFRMVRTSHLPTTLRTSSLSLLAECSNTSSLALLRYIVDLTSAMIDLLQVETVPSTPQKPKTATEEEQDIPTPTIDSQPTAVNSKFPPLRRAALHFLSLLTRTYAAYIAEGSTSVVYTLPRQLLQRANRTVGYIAITDEDNVVRVMAKEALEGLNGLEELILGI